MRVSISAISLLLSFVLNWTVYAILAGIYYGWELFRKCKAFISFFGSVLEIAKSKGHYFRYFIFWIVKPTKLYKLINKNKIFNRTSSYTSIHLSAQENDCHIITISSHH